jgi:S1-C subfamily serine protease
MTLPVAAGGTQSDTTVAFGGGGGIDYWVYRHIGVQLGPIDYIYTHHLNSQNVPSQTAYRIAAGVAFRFGGDLNQQPKTAESKPKRSGKNQQPATVVYQPPATPTMTARGMSLPVLGVVVAPQEFDGAKVVDVVSGGVAQMASLKPGDLIRSVDGKVVKTPMELAAELSDKTGKVRLGILRGDVAAETVVLLGH